MSFLDRFRSKKDKKGGQGPKEDYVSPGGSAVYRYDEPQNEGWRPPQTSGAYAEEITAHFQRLFPGRESFVFHEIVSDLVHIDVNIMAPTQEHSYYVVYTTGMSDLPMTLPEELADREDLKYAELFLFLPGDWDLGGPGAAGNQVPEKHFWPIRTLKFLARFPHEYHTWLAWGHTIPNGPNYTPLDDSCAFGGVVLGQAGGDLGGIEAKDGRRVSFYMAIPAYREEIEFKLERGMEALDALYAEKSLPVVLDVNRPNYCGS